MKNRYEIRALAVVLVAALMSNACREEPGEEADSGVEDFMCDPVGPNAEMGMLLNAPVADDVEVIEKDPQHPGPPGPLDLP